MAGESGAAEHLAHPSQATRLGRQKTTGRVEANRTTPDSNNNSTLIDNSGQQECEIKCNGTLYYSDNKDMCIMIVQNDCYQD